MGIMDNTMQTIKIVFCRGYRGVIPWGPSNGEICTDEQTH